MRDRHEKRGEGSMAKVLRVGLGGLTVAVAGMDQSTLLNEVLNHFEVTLIIN